MSEKTTSKKDICFSVRLTPWRGAWGLLLFLILGAPEIAGRDSVELTTYSSPSGIYTRIQTRGNTTLGTQNNTRVFLTQPWETLPPAQRDPKNPDPKSRFGIGTTNPMAKRKLHVKGSVKVDGCIRVGKTQVCDWP